MANISTGGGAGAKKSVDSEIPLVPFIDLLLCCIMFLLVTAVWNQLASVEAHLDGPGTPQSHLDQRPPELPLTVRVSSTGYTLSTGAGDEFTIPMADEDSYDTAALREHLATRRQLDPNRHAAVLMADDGVQYASVVQTMDLLSGGGFPEVTISGAM